MNKWLYVLGVLLIAGFAVLGAMELKDAQTPYVTTRAEAEAAKGRPIQFMGSLVPGKTSYDKANDELHFVVKGRDGSTIGVRYKGVKPSGFDTAESAVVKGTYRGNEIVANQVLLKCPSKYKNRK